MRNQGQNFSKSPKGNYSQVSIKQASWLNYFDKKFHPDHTYFCHEIILQIILNIKGQLKKDNLQETP